MKTPKAAVLVSTYQRPHHLKRALCAIALQQGVEGKIEVVVTDDGSEDDTPRVVAEFARAADLPVTFTTHVHAGFQLSRCRNEGAAASTAPFLLFLDGDCMLPPDHLERCLRHSRPGVVTGGYCCYLERAASQRVTEETIRSGEYLSYAPRRDLRRLRKMDLKARWYNLIRHPTKPKLFGGNIGIWRTDYQRVNGYDECFQGWGCEDDDLRLRLRRAGVRIEPIRGGPRTIHLWHPPGVSTPHRWCDGTNVEYFGRKFRLTRCMNGLTKRNPGDLTIRVVGKTSRPETAAALLQSRHVGDRGHRQAEVEILFLPGAGTFSGRADCHVLVVLEDSPSAARMARKAHLIVSDRVYPGVAPPCSFRLGQFDRALAAIAGDVCRAHDAGTIPAGHTHGATSGRHAGARTAQDRLVD